MGKASAEAGAEIEWEDGDVAIIEQETSCKIPVSLRPSLMRRMVEESGVVNGSPCKKPFRR